MATRSSPRFTGRDGKSKERQKQAAPAPLKAKKRAVSQARAEPIAANSDRVPLQLTEPDDEDSIENADVPALKIYDAPAARKRAPATVVPASSVVYLGHLPYGFFEEQLEDYFSQFGRVVNLRLARNRTTAKSKHFAFVEFENQETAAIVAQAMNGYFLFGRTLVCQVVPPEKLHPDTFRHANRKWQATPWRDVARKRHNKSRTVSEQASRSKGLVRAEEAKRKQLMELGIDYDFGGYKAAAKRVKTS
jgi:nucleolar protein 15